MKKQLLLCLLAFGTLSLLAQDLPQNPEPGKCYVRCTTPDIYINEEVKIQIKPSYKIIKTIPAKFEKRIEKVLVKAEGKKLKVIPAKWGEEVIEYVKKDASSILSPTPAKFNNDFETIEIKPKYAQWEMDELNPDCESSNPDDCKVWCYKGYPAEFKTVNIKKLDQNATVSRKPIELQKATFTRTVITESARVVEEIIPAEYATITKNVRVEDAKTIEEIVPAEYVTVSREVLKEKGGLTQWKEVDCSLVEYQALPIN